jgi:hypothetical protein
MLFDGLEILEGSQVVNFSLPSGASFPTSPDQGEVFYKTDVKKPYIYIDAAWVEMSTGSSTSNSGDGAVEIAATISSATGTEGKLVYALDTGKLYVHDGVEFKESFTESPKVYDIAITAPGDVTAASTILFFVSARTVTIPQTFSGSYAAIGTNLGDATFTLYKNGSSVATVAFLNGSTTGVFTAASAITLAAGDVLSMDSPAENAPQNLAITIKASI